ncbi:MAG: protoporphyrinogen oxidase HemJ [Hyphomicrobiaceae bacterium]
MELWIKALHIMAVISWMAGILYLPRLFVYHADAAAGSELANTLTIMERRLLKIIMTPAMIAAWVFGLWAAVNAGAFSEGWFHVKLVLVILMTALHMALAKWRKELEAGNSTASQKLFRIINEVPAVMMVMIVILVVVRPF